MCLHKSPGLVRQMCLCHCRFLPCFLCVSIKERNMAIGQEVASVVAMMLAGFSSRMCCSGRLALWGESRGWLRRRGKSTTNGTDTRTTQQTQLPGGKKQMGERENVTAATARGPHTTGVWQPTSLHGPLTRKVLANRRHPGRRRNP